MKCNICNSNTSFLFKSKVLHKYEISYFRCVKCQLIQTEKPYWLKEAYSSALIDSDTGVISRNLTLSKITALLLLFFVKRKSKVLDYGGGYGILTRMLRDIGVDCYWVDKYAENIFANGFEDKTNNKYNMVTAFELFEHFEDPIKETEKIVKKYRPKILLFSTMLHNGNPPKDWWYFVPEGGQHITLYTKKSLEILGDKKGMKLSTNGRNLHILSKNQISGFFMKVISIVWPLASIGLPLFYKSKTIRDREEIVI